MINSLILFFLCSKLYIYISAHFHVRQDKNKQNYDTKLSVRIIYKKRGKRALLSAQNSLHQQLQEADGAPSQQKGMDTKKRVPIYIDTLSPIFYDSKK
ncbi:hypothetical protein HQ36_05720 [Porphyromonas gingivicanis]|uniref:Uncharacterized protein n=1 Tax=Porphyromonas gingivicanis TaxID=266762 RepID=A0A0A2G5V9_9PORP|nr:hypothetical protein HQ36_05720 [Porphyromonas gingivicanis]